MLWIIDGYNLMYQWGAIPRREQVGSAHFARYRQKFVDWLTRQQLQCHPQEQVEVVFDALDAPCPTPPQVDQNVRIIYAYKSLADHWIENRLRELTAPRRVTVVSDDHQIQHMARRYECAWMDCQPFLEYWSRQRPLLNRTVTEVADSSAIEEEKRPLTAAEEVRLLHEFQQRPRGRGPRRPLRRR